MPCRSLPLLLLLVPLATPAADLLDRIAVSVGNRVITTSDIDREIRINAFLAGAKPDFAPAARRATAERMVEQTLVRRELETSRYPIPAASEIEPALDDFKRTQFAGEDEYRRALESYGITEQDVKDQLLWQRTLLMFLGVRFRSGVQVTADEIRDYYDRVVEPAAKAAHPGQVPTLENYREQIEEKLTGDRVDRDMDAWLREGRKRTEIIYHDEAFR